MKNVHKKQEVTGRATAGVTGRVTAGVTGRATARVAPTGRLVSWGGVDGWCAGRLILAMLCLKTGFVSMVLAASGRPSTTASAMRRAIS